jgi:hypothetical protein
MVPPNGHETYTKWPWNIYQMAMKHIPNGHETYQMFVKYSEWPKNMPNLYIPKPSKQFFV